MPTIRFIDSKVNDEFAAGNLTIFLALCTRLGVTEVILTGKPEPDHFYAVAHGTIVDFWADSNTVSEITKRIKKAGIEVLPYAGRVMLDFKYELEELEGHVKEIARNAAGRYLFACPKCHRAIGDDKFCPYCGTKTDAHLLWCSKCKLGFPPAFAYCARCGGLLEPTEEDWFNYLDPGHIFEGVYLRDEEVNKSPEHPDP